MSSHKINDRTRYVNIGRSSIFNFMGPTHYLTPYLWWHTAGVLLDMEACWRLGGEVAR